MAKKQKLEAPVISEKLVIFAKKLRVYKDKKEDLENQLEELKKGMDDFNTEFVELMEVNELKKFTIDKVGTVYIEPDIYPTVLDKPLFHKWLRANNFGDLIKEEVHYQTMKAFLKEQLESKNKLPEGIKIFPKSQVRIRRSK
jgi:hypothetical protein